MLDSRFAAPGSEMFTVGGRRIHVACLGQGSPTYVLDGGLGAWSVHWWRVQAYLAKSSRARAVDRPGEGWSDAFGAGHDGASAADELVRIVKAANIAVPFWYVGHSLGANFAQVFYAKYPEQVAGLVLIEPGDPKNLLEDFHGSRAQAMNAPECGASCLAAGAAGYLGITRLVALSARGAHFPGAWKDQYRAGLARPSHWMNVVANFSALPATAYQDSDVNSFRDTPVLIFDSTLPRDPEGKETVADVRVWKRGQLNFLARLAAKSKDGIGPIHVPDSNHATIILGEAQAAFVARTIIEFATHARSDAR